MAGNDNSLNYTIGTIAGLGAIGVGVKAYSNLKIEQAFQALIDNPNNTTAFAKIAGNRYFKSLIPELDNSVKYQGGFTHYKKLVNRGVWGAAILTLIATFAFGTALASNASKHNNSNSK